MSANQSTNFRSKASSAHLNGLTNICRIGFLGTACVMFVLCAVSTSAGQTFTTLLDLTSTTGSRPGLGSLVQGANGNLYGTLASGGANGGGTVFEITPAGVLTTLYNFCSQSNCTDGEDPSYGLVLAKNGNFYGTTTYGGSKGDGTVFEITPGGKLTTLHSFNYTDGLGPTQLIQATDGNFYGMTQNGGTSGYYCSGCGTIFKITPAGKFTTLYNFCSQTNCTDGWEPIAGLVQARNGNFYGTTDSGGANNIGSVFEITAAGKLTTLHSFCSKANCVDGAYPTSSLIQASDGFLYGTTTAGGTNCGYLGGCGIIFKISTSGRFTRFYSFCAQSNCDDGSQPEAGLIQGTNGNFFGTTAGGGANGYGNVFEISTRGTVTTLHLFNYTDGYYPLAGLVQATNGDLYGTTNLGGSDGVGTLGTIFDISLGAEVNLP